MHDAVVHQQNFIDPVNRKFHTENVETLWVRAKHKLHQQYGMYQELFPSYKFVFRNKSRSQVMSVTFMNTISENYTS